MNKVVIKAIRGSIAKWKAIVARTSADRGSHNCPLCTLFYAKACAGCPVANAALHVFCHGTPYQNWVVHHVSDHDLVSTTYGVRPKCPTCATIAKSELRFLRSLLPRTSKPKRKDKSGHE